MHNFSYFGIGWSSAAFAVDWTSKWNNGDMFHPLQDIDAKIGFYLDKAV